MHAAQSYGERCTKPPSEAMGMSEMRSRTSDVPLNWGRDGGERARIGAGRILTLLGGRGGVGGYFFFRCVGL